MSTNIRPKISTKNKYWIEKHRYYELKHFCLQYPLWKRAYTALDGFSKNSEDLITLSKTNTITDKTEKCAELREFYFDRLKMIEQATTEATNANNILYRYILKGVTEGISYDHLKAMQNIPCGKDIYYELYRRFFWILSENRQ